ncbi:MAG: hypothetical protein JOZ27_07965 [Caulobacteraceae bacterium]|nr:hypothetical protein [Caulobacteraceae bacterium]
MRHRRLGASGRKVGEVGLGCNNYGMRIDQAATNAVVAAALDAGVTPLLYAGGRPILHLSKIDEPRAADGTIDHVSFASDDFDAALARLGRAGVCHSRSAFPDGRGEQPFLRDTNGELIEITCRS